MNMFLYTDKKKWRVDAYTLDQLTFHVIVIVLWGLFLKQQIKSQEITLLFKEWQKTEP